MFPVANLNKKQKKNPTLVIQQLKVLTAEHFIALTLGGGRASNGLI